MIFNQIKSRFYKTKNNSERTKKILIFSGLVFYPITLFICYLFAILYNKFFHHQLSLFNHLEIWISALLLCGIVLIMNLRDYLIYKRRCYGSLTEWLTEERYTPARCKAMYPPINRKLLHKEPTGICIGKIGFGIFKRYVCIDPSDKQIANHIVVIGNSSAGKSSGPILTSLITNFMQSDDSHPPPITYLVIDPKPELCKLSSDGSKWTRILNPMARRGSSYGWDLYYDITPDSPIDRITDRIEGIVNVIIQDSNEKNAFFTDSAKNLLLGCLIYEFIVNKNNFIMSIKNILSSDLNSYIQIIKINYNCPKKVLMLLAEFGDSNDNSNATQDIKKTLKQQTAVFTRQDTEWFLDSNINKLMCSPLCLDESISMFLSIARADLTTFGVLFRIIISQCSDHLSRREDYNSNDKPVAIIIDEFTNIGGTIPHFAEDLGFIRSKKVTYVTIFQQYSQLQQLYGEKQARTILNMGHQLILSCEDTELGRIFSDKAGEFIDRSVSYRESSGMFSVTSEKNVSTNKEKRVRVMDDLTSLYPRFESIAFINGSQYIRFDKCRYYLEPNLRKRSAGCVQYHEYISADTTKESEVQL